MLALLKGERNALLALPRGREECVVGTAKWERGVQCWHSAKGERGMRCWHSARGREGCVVGTLLGGERDALLALF